MEVKQGGELTARESGRIGGLTRAANMTPEERSRNASLAAAARHGIPVAPYHGSFTLPGRPATKDDKGTPSRVISCAVLPDGRRVIAQESFLNAIGRHGKPSSRRTTGKTGVVKLPSFFTSEALIPFIPNELQESSNCIIYKLPDGTKCWGYEAKLLPMACEVYLAAREAGALRENQQHIAAECERLMRAFGQVAVAAMVDDATGYVKVRQEGELQAILSHYINTRYSSWALRFKMAFYEALFKLRGWRWNRLGTTKRPGCVAYYTIEIVYRRLAPGLLEKLESQNPVQDNGRRKVRHHQFLTEHIGLPELDRHLTSVTSLMQGAHRRMPVGLTEEQRKEFLKANWRRFKKMLNIVHPKGQRLLHQFLFPGMEDIDADDSDLIDVTPANQQGGAA